MTGMTWLMVIVVLVWTALFLYFTFHDLKCEKQKEEILAAGEELDPFLFTGEKARAEAREAYLNNDKVLKHYFDEQDVVKFLGIEK